MEIDLSAWSGVSLGPPVDGGHRNDVWSGRAPSGRVAIRRSRRSPASLAWELDLLGRLDDAGFLVPRPLPTIDGRPSADGIVVQRWIDGRPPVSAKDWSAVADELRRLHEGFADHPQRPGCRSVDELGRSDHSVDADLSQLPDEVATEVLGVWSSMGDVQRSVVHGDPGPSNLRITPDGRVGLLDWDESRVDVVHLDLADLGVQVLGDADHRRAVRCAHAWETANAWSAEPEYARERFARLLACNTEPNG